MNISAKAEYRHTDYHFPRSQSPATRNAKWEMRITPIRGWGYDLACAVPFVLSLAIIVVMT